MFLNGLKVKSIIRKLKNETQNRAYIPSPTSIKSVGIIQKEERSFDPKKITQLAAVLGIKEKDIEIISYVNKISKDQKVVEGIFSESGIGWNAALKTSNLKTFTSKKFDILLSYYSEDRLSLKVISGLSKATFKVGVNHQEEALHDLTISTEVGQEDIFINELEKYLQILKII